MPTRWLIIAAFVIAFIQSTGCAKRQHCCVPAEMTRAGPLVDLSAPSGENQPIEQSVMADLLKSNQAPLSQEPEVTVGRQYQILALSGGAVYGAYTAGVLNGWTRAGNRPNFDIVTGISTGGLISNFAYLGPAYDQRLAELYTTITSDDIYHKRLTISLLWSDSAASSKPLKRIIDSQVDCEFLAQIARAHACGRRLYIGTTDLDHRKLVIWDMGAIASSGRPDAVELYRKIVLASASVPGFFPPVPINVTVNGQQFSEWHGDGGASSQVFVPASVLKFDRSILQSGKKPLTNSDVHVILAGKLYADPQCVEPKITSIAGGALSSLTYAQARNDLIRIWTICQLSGMRYHATSIPQDYPATLDSLSFKPDEMRRLYDLGFCHGMASHSWRKTPPGTEATEQFVPRSGTDFLAPVVIDSLPAQRR